MIVLTTQRNLTLSGRILALAILCLLTMGLDPASAQDVSISNDHLVQQSRFSSGWTVVVNFSDTPWNDPRGFPVEAHSHHMFRE